MLNSGNVLKYFRVHSKQIYIFKKSRFISIWNKYVWLYKHADFESIIYARLNVSKINIGSIHDNYIFLPNLRNIRH